MANTGEIISSRQNTKDEDICGYTCPAGLEMDTYPACWHKCSPNLLITNAFVPGGFDEGDVGGGGYVKVSEEEPWVIIRMLQQRKTDSPRSKQGKVFEPFLYNEAFKGRYGAGAEISFFQHRNPTARRDDSRHER